MIRKNTVTDRTSIALTKDALTDLKVLSKKSALRMYEVMEALIDLAKNDADVHSKAIAWAKKKKATNKSDAEMFSQKLAKLPDDLQAKLKDMSSEDLAELLKKAGV